MVLCRLWEPVLDYWCFLTSHVTLIRASTSLALVNLSHQGTMEKDCHRQSMPWSPLTVPCYCY